MPPRRYESRLWIISILVASTFVSQSMLAPLVPLMAIELGASPLGVGFVVSVAYVLPLFLAMPAGSLVDLWGARGMIRWGCLMLMLGPLLVGSSPGMVTLTVSQLLTGLGHLMVVVAAQSYVGALGRGRKGEGNFGWYSTFIAGGALIGPLLGGLTADGLGFQEAFLIAGVFPFTGIFLTGLLGPRPGGRASLVGVALFGKPGQVGRLLRDPAMRVAMVVSCGVLFAVGAYGAFLPAYLNSLEFPATLIGALVSIRALSAMVVRPFMGKIIALLGGRAGTFMAMTLVVGLGVGLTGFAESLPFLILLGFAVGAGSGLTQPVSMVTVVDHVDEKERGFALGLRLTGNRVVQLLGPLVMGIVAEIFGFQAAFMVGGAGLIASMILIARWGSAAEAHSSS